MPLQNDLFLNWDCIPDYYDIYSNNENFFLVDNFAYPDKLISGRPTFYNSSFYFTFFVNKGVFKVIIDGVEVNVGENDYLAIMPCTTITFLKSKATIFLFIVRAHICVNVYKQLHVEFSDRMGLFTFYHHHMNKDIIIDFKNIYNQMASEMKRKPYKFQEMALKEFISIYIIQMVALVNKYPYVEYYKNTRQRALYLKMLELLHENYNKNRSVAFYADKLCITSKYLSNITIQYTGYPASMIIDNFVMFYTKVMLYDGELNIKKISDLLNFQSHSFFGRYFKRNTGMSPREFISKYNKRLFISE